MAKQGDTPEKKEKRPQALKRVLQDEKRRVRNRTYKARVRTAIRKFDEIVSKGDADASKQGLNDIYSIMDKGVKHGIIKKNKANRTKARLAARTVAS